MKKFTELTDEEIKMICGLIPRTDVLKYFESSPKQLAKLFPGFRAKKILETEESKNKVLFEKKDDVFINKFIKSSIDEFLAPLNVNDSFEITPQNIQALVSSPFSNNIELYFSLTEVKLDDKLMAKTLENLLVSMKQQQLLLDAKEDKEKQMLKKQSSLTKEIQIKEKKINKFENEQVKLIKEQKELLLKDTDKTKQIEILARKEKTQEKNHEVEKNKCKQEITQLIRENEELKKETLEKYEALKKKKLEIEDLKKSSKLVKLEKQNESLFEKVNTLVEKNKEFEITIEKNDEMIEKITRGKNNLIKKIDEYIIENEKLKQNRNSLEDQLEATIKDLENAQLNSNILSEQNSPETTKNEQKGTSISYPKKPCNIEEFKEFLGHNLDSIGVKEDEKSTLREYLGKILFTGIPIVMNRMYAKSLIECVSNTIIGTKNFSILTYNQDLCSKDIQQFLESSGRIAYLDNFLGNYNETELFTFTEQNKDKIIILTVFYEKTLKHLPMELLQHFHYLNINRMFNLMVIDELKEVGSRIDETTVKSEQEFVDRGLTRKYQKMLGELKIPAELHSSLSSSIMTIKDIEYKLSFSLFPYYIEILGKDPRNFSEELGKYCNSDLIAKWYK